MTKTTLIPLLATVILLAGCQKDNPDTGERSQLNLPEHPYDYSVNLPLLFRNVAIVDGENIQPQTPGVLRINDNIATLGRVLFYDKMLSLNNSVSCASCHVQRNAFADPVRFSEGFERKFTDRNSLHIANAFMNFRFFWDERADSLSQQVLMPVKNHVEMGYGEDEIPELVNKLQRIHYYPDLFQRAFGSDLINEQGITRALEEFIRSMVSCNSKFDKEFSNPLTHDPNGGAFLPHSTEDFSQFTQKELLGKELFFNKLHCGNCHSLPNFANTTWSTSANIGLDEHYEDEGMGGGTFKIPSLRNVALTAPYMHDGRFETLEEVIEHYNSGVQLHPFLHWSLSDFSNGFPVNFAEDISLPSDDSFLPTGNSGVPLRLNMTKEEKEALIVFLETLTDYEFIRDPKFSDPFM